MDEKKVIAITGVGGIGVSIARRIGTGYKLVLADSFKERLEYVSNELISSGYDVETFVLDVVNKHSVENFAKIASGLGDIHALIHTAGISPTMSKAERIIDVNLIGTARIIEAFEKYLSPGTVGIIVASMAGNMATDMDLLIKKQISKVSADELKLFIHGLGIQDAGMAYTLSKQGNILQVQAAAVNWGNKGARIVSVSPGLISTPMGQQEKKGRPEMDLLLKKSPIKRIGTPEDIAALVDFLQGPSAGYITGTDFLVDGGVIALTRMMSLG